MPVTNHTIPEHLLPPLSEYLTAHTGLYFPQKRWNTLKQRIVAAAKDFHFEDVEAFIQWLLKTPLAQRQIELLSSRLTVGETYFFRDNRVWKTLEQVVLPELIHNRRKTEKRLRIWSAGCCTGEEPYSIAILLKKLIPDLKDWHITILATDINPEFLKKAGEGIYTTWSFRGVSAGIKNRYFTGIEGNRYKIQPDIMAMVTFSYLNLAADVYPSLQNNTNAMDLILCRNVLMYFAGTTARAVVQRFYQSLLDDGRLIISPTEMSLINSSSYVPEHFSGITLYKKESRVPEKQPERVPVVQDERPLPGFLPVISPPPSIEHVTMPANRASSAKTPRETSSGHRADREKRYEDALDCYRLGRYEQSEDILQDLASTNGSDPNVTMLLAQTTANQGKLEEAARWCEQAIQYDRLVPDTHYLLATILEEQGRTEEAMVSLKRALYLDPEFALAHFTLGSFTKKQGNRTGAQRHYRNSLEILSKYRQEDPLPGSDGITAGRLADIIASISP